MNVKMAVVVLISITLALVPLECQSFKALLTLITKKRIDSRLYLFDLLQRQETKENNARSSRKRVSDIEIDFMESGFGLKENAIPPFPYSIELNNQSADADRLIIRHLEDEDITRVLPEIVREFGALVSALSVSSSTPKIGDDFTNKIDQQQNQLADKIENYLFSLTVLIGLTQRVVRREKGYSRSNSACPDHNTICLIEQTLENNTTIIKDRIVGMAELSWQPPNPNSNAPPFVLPYFMKELISKYGPSREAVNNAKPIGYISNVLVWKKSRGKGYGRILMAACEGIARLWGCDDVSLHVDANERSGKVARSLYWKLGYEGVPDRGTSNSVSYDWMGKGISMANTGLYLVDGVPLLYLRKNLKNE